MCGIAGFVNRDGSPASAVILNRMDAAIAHRGPDGFGFFNDGPMGMAHRRLAIIDLSAAAHQPMSDETGNYVLTYNGEIYNFRELRVELEALGHRFHSDADSEVAVHAYEEWGEASVPRFNGMFAFAIWDRARRRLFLARDRYGIKPLYWYEGNGALVFASGIKALLMHPDVRREVSYPALNEYFSFQNIYSDLTLFEGVRLLKPGHMLTVELGTGAPTPHQYWDFKFSGDQGLEPREASERVHELFVQGVTRQLVSDVPVGAYLSGGLDSSSITAVAARSLPRLRTFTGGFDLSSATGLELAFDERPAAEHMANHLKSEHYEVVMHAGDMEAVLPELIWHLEDLRMGQSYPNYYVARLASKFVKVALSGAGGDELFAGYPWRYYTDKGSNGRAHFLQNYFPFWQRLVKDEEKPSLFSDTTRRRLADTSAFDAFAAQFESYEGEFATRTDSLQACLYFELKTFLPGLLLVEDKVSMAHGLETRVPFLDNDLVDFAQTIPAHLNLKDYDAWDRVDENEAIERRVLEASRSDGKALFRDAMTQLLPMNVRSRPKQGFAAPDASWFRGESIDYIGRLFANPKAMLYEYLDRRFVQSVIDEHSSGRTNRRLLIWSLLSFEWWCRTFLSGAALDRSPAPDRPIAV